MTAQELKNSILQLAVQGKLVPQDSSDEPASELLKRIQAEKARLIKEGKIKKEKALPPIAEEELPFDIPENWVWVHLLEVAYQVGNKENQILANEVKATGKFPAVSQGKNLIDGYCDCEEKVISDLPLIMFGDHTRNVKYVDFPFVISADGTKFLKAISIKDKYLFYWTVLSAEMLRDRGYARHFSLLKQLYLPLPPLEEQRRIIDKIEELLPLLEEYGKAETRLKTLNEDFPDMLRKSILQQAVQGKLTERDPADEPASELLKRIQAEKAQLIKDGKIKKEKPLPPITEDEIPFDIPDAWQWVRLGTLYSFCNGTASRGSDNGQERAVLRLADLSNNKIETDNIRRIKLTDAEFLSHQLRKDDMVFIRVNGSKDRVATAFHYTSEEIISYCDHLFCGNRCSTLIAPDYVMLAFNSPYTRKQLTPEIKTSAGQNTISQGSMAKMILPLPPIEEQKRIVARVEELLVLFDSLNKNNK